MILNQHVLAVIPARGGSKGLPKKNLAQIQNNSLVELAINAAKECGEIDQVVVSTDSPEIASKATAAGVPTGKLRPPELSLDETSAVAVANYLLDDSELMRGIVPDILVWLEPTSPLRSSANISEMLHKLTSNPDADAIVSVGRIRHDPTVLRVLDGKWLIPFDRNARLIERRQDAREVWFPFGVAYICRTKAFRSQQTFYPKNTLGYEIERFQEFEIDDIYDLIAVRSLAEWMQSDGS
jgi:CMP-N,N'-diacetyllegionaminic acid synthase